MPLPADELVIIIKLCVEKYSVIGMTVLLSIGQPVGRILGRSATARPLCYRLCVDIDDGRAAGLRLAIDCGRALIRGLAQALK